MELSSHLEDKSNLREIGKAQAENAISIRDVKFRYTKRSPYVLNIENLRIQKGERVSIIGPSGAGKTTLMRLINGVIEHESGEVKILGKTFDGGSKKSRGFRRRIGFIYQNFNLIDRASVFENVLWGEVLYANKKPKRRDGEGKGEKGAGPRIMTVRMTNRLLKRPSQQGLPRE